VKKKDLTTLRKGGGRRKRVRGGKKAALDTMANNSQEDTGINALPPLDIPGMAAFLERKKAEIVSLR